VRDRGGQDGRCELGQVRRGCGTDLRDPAARRGLHRRLPAVVRGFGTGIREYFVDNDTALKVGEYPAGLAIFPLLIFLGCVWSRVRGAGDETRRLATMLAGGAVVAVGLATVATVITTATAIRIGELNAPLARLLYELADTATDATAFAVAVFVGATSVAALRARVFPAWIGWFGAVLTVAWLVAGLALSTDSDALSAFGFIVFLVWMVWVLALSSSLLRPEQQAATSAA
jgi:hypothetical protein